MSIKNYFLDHLCVYFNRRKNVGYLSLIILLGAALRLYNLGTESFWFDEIITVYRVSQDLQTLVSQIATQGEITRNAVYWLLAHFWVMPFEITEVSIRSLSVLFGVLSIGIMYLVGRQLFGENVGLLSSFFMAISTFQIRHSQEARFYSFFVFLTLISVYCYICALKTKQPRLWIISSSINILLFYTHTYAIFILAVEYIHYFIYWKNNKDTIAQWRVSQLLLMFAIIVGLFPVLREEGTVTGISGGLEWITAPFLKDLLRIVYDYLFPQNYQHDWSFIGASFMAGSAFFIVGAFFFNFQKAKNRWLVELSNWLRNARFLPHVGSEFVLVAAWFVCPVILPFIYSNIFSPILVGRYTICASPAFYLLVAIVITRISHAAPIYLSLGAMMIVIVPGLQDYYATDTNEQWQEVAVYVQKYSQPNDVIVFAPDEEGFQHKSFDWYYHGDLQYCGIESSIKDDQAISNILSSCISDRERFWLIMRGPSKVIDNLKSFFLKSNQINMRLMKEQHFVQISVYLFELKK